MKKVNRILDSMISDIDKVKLGLYEASTKRKKQKFFYMGHAQLLKKTKIFNEKYLLFDN